MVIILGQHNMYRVIAGGGVKVKNMCKVESERHSLTLSVGCLLWMTLQVEQKLFPAESMETDWLNLVQKCLWWIAWAFSVTGCL